MTGSRLDELHVWLDSGLLGEGAVQLVLSGKGHESPQAHLVRSPPGDLCCQSFCHSMLTNVTKSDMMKL